MNNSNWMIKVYYWYIGILLFKLTDINIKEPMA